MTKFQSGFKQELAEYLEISQGSVSDDTLRRTRRALLSFDSLLAEENAGRISETAINHWIKELRQINAPKTVSDKVSCLRKFFDLCGEMVQGGYGVTRQGQQKRKAQMKKQEPSQKTKRQSYAMSLPHHSRTMLLKPQNASFRDRTSSYPDVSGVLLQ